MEDIPETTEIRPEVVITIHQALDKLTAVDAVTADIVRLRFFAGLTNQEAGRALGLAERTVKRHWRWLARG